MADHRRYARCGASVKIFDFHMAGRDVFPFVNRDKLAYTAACLSAGACLRGSALFTG